MADNPNIDNLPVKHGFIFVPADDATAMCNFCAQHCGAWGYFGRLDHESCNGWVPVSFDEYQNHKVKA